MAILLTATLPRFQQTAQRLGTEQAAVSLTQLLRYAHERAVAQGQPIVWAWDAQERRADLSAVGDDGRREPLAERAARTAVMGREITVHLTRDERQVEDVTFFPDGTSEPTTLQVAREPSRFTVTIDGSTGHVVLAVRNAER
jgi:Tfp pilus assembly protein FimT